MIWHFPARHPGPELMDDPAVNAEELRINLQELETINTLLGGYATTFHGLKKLMTDRDRTYRILDIGCGGGDTIAAVHQWAKKSGRKIQLSGLDLSPVAIEKTRERCAHIPGLELFEAPFQQLETLDAKVDICMCSLFCHHFYADDLQSLLRIMHQKSQVGFVINDLERHRLAWASISLLTQILSKSRLVKHDAPLSVRRGFTKHDWRKQLHAAGISNASIEWIWAFRHAITAPRQ